MPGVVFILFSKRDQGPLLIALREGPRHALRDLSSKAADSRYQPIPLLTNSTMIYMLDATALRHIGP